MILHIIPYEKFTQGFIRFVFTNFEEQEHFFVIYGKCKDVCINLDYKNVYYLDSFKDLRNNNTIKKLFIESDGIIINGLFGSQKCLRYFNKSILKKVYIVFWGGDFYCLRNNVGLKQTISNYLRKRFIKKSSGVINLIPDDYRELSKYVKINKPHFVAPICDDGYSKKLFDTLVDTQKGTNPIIIMLGNSAYKTNNHIQALEMLRRYKDEDILIRCPLSYGDDNYAKEVIECGKRIFAEKFQPITDFMKKEDYYRLIAESTVAIYNNDRQQALGNINAALILGCKVYIRNDTAMWNHLHDEDKYQIYDVTSIESMTFDGFVTDDDDLSANRRRYYTIHSIEKNVLAWNTVFSYIRKT